MPELKCTVQTCMHNQDFLCRLDSIQVGGSQAKASKETCCDSFEERKTQGDGKFLYERIWKPCDSAFGSLRNRL